LATALALGEAHQLSCEPCRLLALLLARLLALLLARLLARLLVLDLMLLRISRMAGSSGVHYDPIQTEKSGSGCCWRRGGCASMRAWLGGIDEVSGPCGGACVLMR
jgi:hypothetical protein